MLFWQRKRVLEGATQTQKRVLEGAAPPSNRVPGGADSSKTGYLEEQCIILHDKQGTRRSILTTK
jgi:hypothetical protein